MDRQARRLTRGTASVQQYRFHKRLNINYQKKEGASEQEQLRNNTRGKQEKKKEQLHQTHVGVGRQKSSLRVQGWSYSGRHKGQNALGIECRSHFRVPPIRGVERDTSDARFLHAIQRKGRQQKGRGRVTQGERH